MNPIPTNLPIPIDANITLVTNDIVNNVTQPVNLIPTAGFAYNSITGKASTEKNIRNVLVVAPATTVTYTVNAILDGDAVINVEAGIGEQATVNLPTTATWFANNLLTDKTTTKSLTIVTNGDGTIIVSPAGGETINGKSQIKMNLDASVVQLIAAKDLVNSTDSAPVYIWKVIGQRKGDKIGGAVTVGYGEGDFQINEIRSNAGVFTDDVPVIQKAINYAAKNGIKRIVLLDPSVKGVDYQIASPLIDYNLEISELATQTGTAKFLAENYHARISIEGSSRNTVINYVNNYKGQFFITKYFDLLRKAQPTQTELQTLGQARPRGGSYKFTAKNLLFRAGQFGTGFNGTNTGNTSATTEYDRFSVFKIYGCNILLRDVYFDDVPDFCIIVDYQKFDWDLPKRLVDGTYVTLPEAERELVENYYIDCWSQRHGRGFNYGAGHDSRFINVTGWSFKCDWHLKLDTDDVNLSYPLITGDTPPSGSAGAGLSRTYKGVFTDGGTRLINCHFYRGAKITGYWIRTIMEFHGCELEGGDSTLSPCVWFDGAGANGSKAYHCNVYYGKLGYLVCSNNIKIISGFNAVTNTLAECAVQLGALAGTYGYTADIGVSGYEIELYGITTNSDYPNFRCVNFVKDFGGNVKVNAYMNGLAGYIGGTMSSNTDYDFRFTGALVGANLSNPNLGDWIERKKNASKANVFRANSYSNPTPVNGEFYRDSADGKFKFRQNGVTVELGGTSYTPDTYSQANTITVTNTIVESTLRGTPSNGTLNNAGAITLPANFLTLGKIVKTNVRGVYTAGASANNLVIRVKLGTVNLLGSGTAGITIALPASQTAKYYEINLVTNGRSAGVGGLVTTQGYLSTVDSSGVVKQYELNNTSSVTVDTTIAQNLDVTAQWTTATATESISARTLFIETI